MIISVHIVTTFCHVTGSHAFMAETDMMTRLFQNFNLRILDCTRAQWRGLYLLGEKRQIKEKAKWRQNQIQCGCLFNATWTLRIGKQSWW